MEESFNQISETVNDVPYFKMLIGGEWVHSSSGERFEVKNPATGEVVAFVSKATVDDAKRAIDVAYEARNTIANIPAFERGIILEKASRLMMDNAEILSRRIVLEEGKPIKDALGEVKAAAERVKYASEETKELRGEAIKGDIVSGQAKKIGIVLRYPIGVVAGISPFNYPIYIPISKIAPAIAAGNSVVLKPASDDPTVMFYLAEIFRQAGLPDGVLNVITGSGEAVGDILVTSPKIGMISFTGSTVVGQHVAEKAVLAKLHLELGGKAPALVLSDCDLDLAAKECVKGAFKLSGQRCDAISRVLVEKGVAEVFVAKVLAEAKTWVMGEPTSESTVMGPLINEKGLAKVVDLVNDAVSKGAQVLMGGKVRQGLYFEPTVLTGVTTDMRIAWEETFGPVVTILTVGDYEEAISIANRSEYGLDASVFTNNVDKAMDAATRIEAGTVQINAAPAHGLGNFPFGGDESSGLGREGLKVSVEDMTKLHTIVLNPK